MLSFVPRDASVLKIQIELCYPKCTRKVSGLSRTSPRPLDTSVVDCFAPRYSSFHLSFRITIYHCYCHHIQEYSEFRISIEGVEIVVLVAFETYKGRHHMFFANKIKWLRNWFQIKRCVLFDWSRFGAFFNFNPNDTANIPAETKLEL